MLEVFYSISCVMIVRAGSADEASEAVFAKIHSLIGTIGRVGLEAKDANEVGLSDAVIHIDTVTEVNQNV